MSLATSDFIPNVEERKEKEEKEETQTHGQKKHRPTEKEETQTHSGRGWNRWLAILKPAVGLAGHRDPRLRRLYFLMDLAPMGLIFIYLFIFPDGSCFGSFLLLLLLFFFFFFFFFFSYGSGNFKGDKIPKRVNLSL
jgi:hypothetical protein